MTEGRKIAAILVADIVGYSRLMGAEEEATLARLRALYAELFSPTVEAHSGRLVNRKGDGAVVEFRSVVEAVRCAIDITKGLAERNAPLPPERRIEIRTGIHLGDVIETQDGDLFGDAVNIAARLESMCAPGGVCLSEDAWRQVRDKLPETFVDLGERRLKNIVRPMRVYALAGASDASTPLSLTLDAATHGAPSPRTIPAAVIGVLESVERLTHAYDRPGASGEPAKRSVRSLGRSGISKAVGILETVERIVGAVADQAADRQAAPLDPPGPGPTPGGETADPATPTLGRRDRNSRGPSDKGAT